jgi:hypothetical protein
MSRIGTDISFISNLIAGINKGETKVPKFQRPFVWKDEQALALLDSIANNYPVGSILLWKTREKLRAERNIGEFNLPLTDEMEPTDYVLDGQQRLTVIYSCLGAEESDGGFSAVYDLDGERFLRTPDDMKPYYFPLRKLFNTTRLLNFRSGIQLLSSEKPYQERLDALISAFSDYRLPVVTLRDLSVEEVCPIFERINSSGTKLSTYDLMVAATWNRDFDLNDEVDEVREALRPKGFEDIDPETVLKCMSAVKLGTIKEQSLKSLRGLDRDGMRELVHRTKNSLLHTVDLLSTEFKIHSWDFLSYEALAIILSRVFDGTHQLSPEQVQRVRQWFWRSSFSERYKVGGESFVSNDIATVLAFVESGSPPAAHFGDPPTATEWMNISFRSNVSRSRAFILALAAARPRNITNGSAIDPSVALSAYNKKQFHHVYPRAFLKRLATSSNDNLVINICMLPAAANNVISDTDPRVYLPRYAGLLGSEADQVFSSNLLPSPTAFDYATATYDEFLRARSSIVAEVVGKLCDGRPI